MADDSGRKALGRGLAALIGDVESESEIVDRARGSRRVPIAFVRPNPRNPRKGFDNDELESLTASIREKGIVQPILVRAVEGDANSYEIIAGERRWRAAQRAGLHEVPVQVHNVSDKEALEIAIVENVQRADLNALEEAMGYQDLIETFGYSQSEVANAVGKSRPHVANMMRLLKLPEEVQVLLRDGELTAGHARALLSSQDPAAVAKQIVAGGLTVRDAEAMTARPTATPRKSTPKRKDADTVALERALSDATGLKVTIDHRSNGTGEVKVRYLDLDQLDDVCRRLQSP